MADYGDRPSDVQAIDDALERIVANKRFRNSARKRRFLEFIVRETQAGRAEQIKAYTIAMDVFDRDSSFDPLTDPVVRIQAGRLRCCLEQYYLNEGATDPVRITIPKGTYVPQFIARPKAAGLDMDGLPEARPDTGTPQGAGPVPPPAPARGMARALWLSALAASVLTAVAVLLATAFWRSASPPPTAAPPLAGQGSRTAVMHGPSLLVMPFVNKTGDTEQETFAADFTEDLIGALVRFKNLFVFGADGSFPYGTAPPPNDAEFNARIDYMLKGSINRVGDQIRINTALVSAKETRYIWSDTIQRGFNTADATDLRQTIATQIARTLAQPRGVIQKEEARASATRPPSALSSYECMLRTFQYFRRIDAQTHAQVRGCLERAIRTDPLYADAWSALSMVYADEFRLGLNPEPGRPDPVAAGLEFALHAVDLAPDSAFSHQALGHVHWVRRKPQQSIAAYEQAHALNPYDSDILADLGRSLSLTGDYGRGIPMIREALRNPDQPPWYRLILALDHYLRGRYDEALEEVQNPTLPDIVLVHVARGMIHGRAGNGAEAAREVAAILRLDPGYAAKAAADLERRNIEPAAIAAILDGLRKAGLPVSVSRGGSED